jgi:hypothetical protein
MATIEQRQEVCRQIAADAAADAANFDGKPFNGRTVAQYLGNHGASIAALAKLVESLLEDAKTKS